MHFSVIVGTDFLLLIVALLFSFAFVETDLDDLIGSKACYRSMGTTGDPVPVGQRASYLPAYVNASYLPAYPVQTGGRSALSGEPLHRLEPVPVNNFTG